jgi:hypothetical protein
MASDERVTDERLEELADSGSCCKWSVVYATTTECLDIASVAAELQRLRVTCAEQATATRRSTPPTPATGGGEDATAV